MMKDKLAELQSELAFIDMMSPMPGFIQLLVKKLLPLKIKMYQEINHQLPHIHIDYGHVSHAASYSIESGVRLTGALDKKYDKKVKIWIESNRRILQDIWNDLQAGKNDNYEVSIGQLNEN